MRIITLAAIAALALAGGACSKASHAQKTANDAGQNAASQAAAQAAADAGNVTSIPGMPADSGANAAANAQPH